jgi:hypothetical protein
MAGGGTVTFACDGTINLANTVSNDVDTLLDGSGHQITISGNTVARVFYVNTNVTFTLANLAVANGRSIEGAGIFNAGGTLILLGDAFQTNIAFGDSVSTDPIGGGAVYNQAGTVCATNCTFLGNQAALDSIMSEPPSVAGGAMRNEGGNLVLEACVFTANQAAGGNVTAGICTGGNALGGAIFNNGTNIVDLCTFSQNSAGGGDGGSPYPGYVVTIGGSASGGAICNSESLTVSRTSFMNNSALGGVGIMGIPGGMGGTANGAAIYNSGVLFLQASTLEANAATGGGGGAGSDGGSTYYPIYGGNIGQPGYPGGDGGSASGALYNAGTANLVNDTVAVNNAFGGSGGAGGAGGSSTVQGMVGGIGGRGGDGGSSFGGICDVSSLLQLTNCTVASNSASAGCGGSGGPDGPPPNFPWGFGATGSNGIAAGGVAATGCVAISTLMASNTPLNFMGTNLNARFSLSSDASCGFTGEGCTNNTDPKLGPLADNGGPTLTMALLPGSPAIDAGYPLHAPATDQRGVVRPQGPGVDIGAFEYQYLPLFSGLKIQNATNCSLQMCGFWSNQPVTLQASSNLLTWWDVTNFVAGTNGTCQMIDPVPGNWTRRFYRLESITP